MPEEEKEKLILQCPQCGCGDVRWCGISHRAYCGDCLYWAPVNYGSDEDAIREWNRKLEEAGRPLYPGSIDQRLDYIYDFVDYMMKSGQFDALDHMLLHLKEPLLTRDEIIGFLTATLPAKSKMPNGRPALLDIAKGMFIFEPEMLKGLE